jgi:hypothetical protein
MGSRKNKVGCKAKWHTTAFREEKGDERERREILQHLSFNWFECRTALRQHAVAETLAPGDTSDTSCFKSLQLFDLAGMDCPRSRVAAGAQSEKERGCLPGTSFTQGLDTNNSVLRCTKDKVYIFGTWPGLSRYRS